MRHYWRPDLKASHPNIVAAARNELVSPRHLARNPETGIWELPWAVLDRIDMIRGRPDVGIGPMEFCHPFFVAIGRWPDLLVVARNGWQLPLIEPDGSPDLLFNAGHGSTETGGVMLALRGLGAPAGVTCDDPATLADLGRTIADSWGVKFPFAVGKRLTCNARR